MNSLRQAALYSRKTLLEQCGIWRMRRSGKEQSWLQETADYVTRWMAANDKLIIGDVFFTNRSSYAINTVQDFQLH
jgi:hypothetical protein